MFTFHSAILYLIRLRALSFEVQILLRRPPMQCRSARLASLRDIMYDAQPGRAERGDQTYNSTQTLLGTHESVHAALVVPLFCS